MYCAGGGQSKLKNTENQLVARLCGHRTLLFLKNAQKKYLGWFKPAPSASAVVFPLKKHRPAFCHIRRPCASSIVRSPPLRPNALPISAPLSSPGSGPSQGALSGMNGPKLPRNPLKQERSPATFCRGAPIRCKNSMNRVACETLVGLSVGSSPRNRLTD